MRSFKLLALLIVLAGCSPASVEKKAAPPPSSQPGGTVAVPQAVANPPSSPPSVGAPASIVVPAGALYVCVSEAGGASQTTVIEFAPKVQALCAKNPEMGPCQYERNACRSRGGRVYAANGAEITMQTEAEYDKKVMRVRFKSN